MSEGFPEQSKYAARVSTVDSDEEDQHAEPVNDSNSDKTVEEPTDIYNDYPYPERIDDAGHDPSYRWNFSDLPAAARVACGPMSFEYLAEKINLDLDGDDVRDFLSFSFVWF